MRRASWIILPLILLALLGAAIFATRAPGPTTAFTLRTGDCFDIPADAQVGDITTVGCTTPHDAEVFVAAQLPEASPGNSAGGPAAYPGDASVATWVGTACGSTAQRAYLGGTAHSDLAVGYFFPSADAWAHGERQVTCYLHASSKLQAPLRATGSSSGPS